MSFAGDPYVLIFHSGRLRSFIFEPQPRMISSMDDLIHNVIIPAVPRDLWSYEPEDGDELNLVDEIIEGRIPMCLGTSFDVERSLDDLFEIFNAWPDSELYLVLSRRAPLEGR
ncbi:hypothetical protein N7535_001977 [Penicillium sp. DV-2018c]|nr:hypothetical protein N7535_001977 [Penicillium sp. DV-2018c]